MSAVCLKTITLLCLVCTALSDPESSGVIWRDIGGAITIQCRPSETGQEKLSLVKGLSEDDIFYRDAKSDKITIAKDFKGRLQVNGEFPNIDILIKNLTSKDTGAYWCVYKRFDLKCTTTINKKDLGSVLLVVKERQTTLQSVPSTDSTEQQCAPSNNNLMLASIVVCAGVLLAIIICFLIWIISKSKTVRTTKKPRRAATNDVYEDMRGTLRR